MRFGKKHRTMLIISIFMFLISAVIGYSSSMLVSRDKMHETDMEFEFLSNRIGLVQDMEYYSRDTSLDPEEAVGYYSRSFYPYPSNPSNTFRYNEWGTLYISDNDNYEEVLKANNITNIDIIKPEQDYTSRLPLENTVLLGERYYSDSTKDTLFIFTKDNEILDYYYIDQRIIDFSEFKNDHGYDNHHSFVLKLDDENRLYIDKVEDNSIYYKESSGF